VLCIVADLGNTRLKWGRLGASGALVETIALPLDDPGAWAAAWERWNPAPAASSAWAIASVNPPLAAQLDDFLKARSDAAATWYRSAAEVPIRHALEHAETAGADRALAVAAAIALNPPGQPGLLVACGTAITVERIDAGGLWQGGAIAPGLGLSARALHELTAQLPLVRPRATSPPPAWGRSTEPALEAGVFWGTVGAVRELLTRQAAGLASEPWLVWTGGDAHRLAPCIEWPRGPVRVVPDLVLDGLARIAFAP
jgi:type III pantothenate kinase